MADLDGAGSWIRIVDAILSGQRFPREFVRLGRVPLLLQKYGLGPFDLVMRPGKIARVAHEHPEISRATWHRLPVLLHQPVAVFPSSRRDGTIVPVLALGLLVEEPILVPIIPDASNEANVVLSIYHKASGFGWIAREISRAESEGYACYVGKDFAATQPQPGSASKDTIPSSPGPIPVDGTTKPKRDILGLRKKSILD